jgi:cellulose synthase/poly-beta-1,6-N-acetylglucosamine synthase-like glycosyltransferase
MAKVDISIVIPTMNNIETIEKCLKSVKELKTKYRYEVIVVDGHSTDGTIDVAKKYKAKILFESIGTRAGACNIGIEAAKGEFIFFTDSDCVVPKNWIDGLMKFFKDKKLGGIGGPNLTPKDDTPIARDAGAIISSFFGTAGAEYGRGAGGEVKEVFYNPGCNVAYRKKAIVEAGLFDDKLLTAEDVDLDFRVKSAGYTLKYAPDISVLHYRRSTYKRFFKQSRNYAIGKLQIWRKGVKHLNVFHLLPPLFFLAFFVSIALAFTFPIFKLIPFALAALAIAYLLAVGLNISRRTGFSQLPRVLVLLVLGYTGFAIGFIKGLLSR